MAGKSHYVYSTLANSNIYLNYLQSGSDLPIPDEKNQVLIKGGSGVADRHGETQFGILTEVTDEQLAMLKTNPHFLAHEAAGFVTVTTSKKDPEAVAADMTHRDESAQLTEQDYEEGKAPTSAPTADAQRTVNTRRA